MPRNVRLPEAVFIGRFQPIHRGHLDTITRALEQADTLTLLVGSAFQAPTPKNPFSFAERQAHIHAVLKDELAEAQGRVRVLPLRDRIWNEARWVADVKGAASTEGAALVGLEKDASTYYMKLFPEWKRIPMPNYQGINATDIRKQLFAGENPLISMDLQKVLPPFMWDALAKFQATQMFRALKYEHEMAASGSVFSPLKEAPWCLLAQCQARFALNGCEGLSPMQGRWWPPSFPSQEALAAWVQTRGGILSEGFEVFTNPARGPWLPAEVRLMEADFPREWSEKSLAWGDQADWALEEPHFLRDGYVMFSHRVASRR